MSAVARHYGHDLGARDCRRRIVNRLKCIVEGSAGGESARLSEGPLVCECKDLVSGEDPTDWFAAARINWLSAVTPTWPVSSSNTCALAVQAGSSHTSTVTHLVAAPSCCVCVGATHPMGVHVRVNGRCPEFDGKDAAWNTSRSDSRLGSH